MRLCLGTVQFGTQYGVQGGDQLDKKEVSNILSYAYEHGVHWFDTAEAYGDAEEILGNYIKDNPHKAEHMSVVSKLDPKAFLNVPQKSWKDIVLKHIHNSLKRLNKQYLDAYIFHNASCIFNSDAVDALDIVRKESLAKRIGVSIYTPMEAMQALSYPQIDIIQVPYNVFDHRLDQCGFFKKARKKNIFIFARSSLLQGLAVMGVERLPTHMEFASHYVSTFHTICKNLGISPLQMAVSFAASNPNIDYIVFGVDNSRQISEYITAASRSVPSKTYELFNKTFCNVPEKLVNPSLWRQ